MKIKAITLWQPWASLMARGEKKIETRSWGTNYRGLLAIHAAKRKMQKTELEFCRYLRNALDIRIPSNPDNYPYGKIVAVVYLNLVIPIEHTNTWSIPQWHKYGGPFERVLGDFSPGRKAWITTMIHSCWRKWDNYEAQGHQRLWNWEVPPSKLKDQLSHFLAKKQLQEETTCGENN